MHVSGPELPAVDRSESRMFAAIRCRELALSLSLSLSTNGAVRIIGAFVLRNAVTALPSSPLARSIMVSTPIRAVPVRFCRSRAISN